MGETEFPNIAELLFSNLHLHPTHYMFLKGEIGAVLTIPIMFNGVINGVTLSRDFFCFVI